MAQEIVRSTRGLKSRRLKGHARLTKKITICLASIICCLSFVAIGVLASVTNLELNIDNDAYYYATAFNKNSDDEFMITSYDDLVLMSELVNGGALIPDTNVYYRDAKYLLTTDIDPVQEAINSGVSESTAKSKTYPLNPIGTNETNSFRGEINGNGHTISNITIALTSGGCYGGLFGYTEGATITGVGIGTPEDIAEDGTYTAGKTCTLYYDLNGKQFTIGAFGSIVGYASANSSNNKLTTISQCYNYSDVTTTSGFTFVTSPTGVNGVGVCGIAGITNGASISNCYNTGNITVNSSYCAVAGISCQFSPQKDTVNYCYSTGITSYNKIKAGYALVASFATKDSSATDGKGLYSVVQAGATDSSGAMSVYEVYTSSSVKYGLSLDAVSGEDCLTSESGMVQLQNQIDGADVWHATKNTTQMFKLPQLAIFEKHKTSASDKTEITNKTDSKNHHGIVKTVEIRDFHNFLYDPYGLYNEFTSSDPSFLGAWYHSTNGDNYSYISHTDLNTTTSKFEKVDTPIHNLCPAPGSSTGEGANIRLAFQINSEVVIYANPQEGFEVTGILLVKEKNTDYSYLNDYYYASDFNYYWKNSSSTINSNSSKFSYVPLSMLTTATINGKSAYALGLGSNKLTVGRDSSGEGVLMYDGQNYYQAYILYAPKSIDESKLLNSFGTPGMFGNSYPQSEAEFDTVLQNEKFNMGLNFSTFGGGIKLSQTNGENGESGTINFNDFQMSLTHDITNTSRIITQDTTFGNAVGFYHNGYIGSAGNVNQKYHTIRLSSRVQYHNHNYSSEDGSTTYGEGYGADSTLKPYIFYGFYDVSNMNSSGLSAMSSVVPIAGPDGRSLFDILDVGTDANGNLTFSARDKNDYTATTNVATPISGTDDYYIDLVPFLDDSGSVVYKLLLPDGTLSSTTYKKIIPIYITNTVTITLKLQCFDGDIYTAEHEIDMEVQNSGGALSGASGVPSFVNFSYEQNDGFMIGLSKTPMLWFVPCLRKSIPMPSIIDSTVHLRTDEYYGFNLVGFYTEQYGTGGKVAEVSDSRTGESNYDQETPSFARATYKIDASNFSPFDEITFYIRYTLKQTNINMQAGCYDDVSGKTTVNADDITNGINTITGAIGATNFATKIGYFKVTSVKYIVGSTVENGKVVWGDYVEGTFTGSNYTNLDILGIANNSRVLFSVYTLQGWKIEGFYGSPDFAESSRLTINSVGSGTKSDTYTQYDYRVAIGTKGVRDTEYQNIYIKLVPDNLEVNIGTAYEGDTLGQFVEPSSGNGATATEGGTIQASGNIFGNYFNEDTFVGYCENVVSNIYSLTKVNFVNADTYSTRTSEYLFTLTASAKPGYTFKGWYGTTTDSGILLNGALNGTSITNPSSTANVLTCYNKNGKICVSGGTSTEFYRIYAVFEKDAVTLEDVLRVAVEDTENTIGGTIHSGVAGVTGTIFNGSNRSLLTSTTSANNLYKRVSFVVTTTTSGSTETKKVNLIVANTWVRIYISFTKKGYKFKDYSLFANSYDSICASSQLNENTDDSGNGLGSGFYIYAYVGLKSGNTKTDDGYYVGAIQKIAIPVASGDADAITISTPYESNITTTVKVINQTETDSIYARFSRIPILDAIHAINGTADYSSTTSKFDPREDNHGDDTFEPSLNATLDPANYPADIMGYVTVQYTTGRLAGKSEVISTYNADGTCSHISLSGDIGDKFIVIAHVKDGYKIKTVRYYVASSSNGSVSLNMYFSSEPFEYDFYESTTAKNYETTNNVKLSGKSNNEKYYILLQGAKANFTNENYSNGEFTIGTTQFEYNLGIGVTSGNYIVVAFEPDTYQITYDGNSTDVFGDTLLSWETGATTPTTGADVVYKYRSTSGTATVANTNHAYSYIGDYGLTHSYVNKYQEAVGVYKANGYDFIGWGMYNLAGELTTAIITDSYMSGSAVADKFSYTIQKLLSANIAPNLFVNASSITSADGSANWFETSYRKPVTAISGSTVTLGSSVNLQKELFKNIVSTSSKQITLKALWVPQNLNIYDETYLVLHRSYAVGNSATSYVNYSNYTTKDSYGIGYNKVFKLKNGSAFEIVQNGSEISIRLQDTGVTTSITSEFNKTGMKLIGFNNLLGSDGGTATQYGFNIPIIVDGKNMTLSDDPSATTLYMDLNPENYADFTSSSPKINPYCSIENIETTDEDGNTITTKAKFLHLYAVWQKDVNIYQGSVSSDTNFVDLTDGSSNTYGTLLETKSYLFRFDALTRQTLDLGLSTNNLIMSGLAGSFKLAGYMMASDVIGTSGSFSYSWSGTSFNGLNNATLLGKLKGITDTITTTNQTENICLIYKKDFTGKFISGVYTRSNTSNSLADKNNYKGYELQEITLTQYYYIAKTTTGAFTDTLVSPFLKTDAGDGYIYILDASGNVLSGVRMTEADLTVEVKVKNGTSYTGSFIPTTLKFTGFTYSTTSILNTISRATTESELAQFNADNSTTTQSVYTLDSTYSPVSKFNGGTALSLTADTTNYLNALYKGNVPFKVYFYVDGVSSNSIGNRQYLSYTYFDTELGEKSTGTMATNGVATLTTSLSIPNGSINNTDLYFATNMNSLGTSSMDMGTHKINLPVVDREQTLGRGLTTDVAEWADYTFDGWVLLSGTKISKVWDTDTRTVTKWYGSIDKDTNSGTGGASSEYINREYYIDYDNSDAENFTQVPALAGLGVSVYPVFKYHTLEAGGSSEINPIVVDPESKMTLEDFRYDFNDISDRFTYNVSSNQFTGRATYTGSGTPLTGLEMTLSTIEAKTLTLFTKTTTVYSGSYDWLITAGYTMSDGTTGSINKNNTTGAYTTINIPANTSITINLKVNVPVMGTSSLSSGNYGEIVFKASYTGTTGAMSPLFVQSEGLVSTSYVDTSLVSKSGNVTISDTSITLTGKPAVSASVILKCDIPQIKSGYKVVISLLSDTLPDNTYFKVTSGASLNSAGTDIENGTIINFQMPTASEIQDPIEYYECYMSYTYDYTPNVKYIKIDVAPQTSQISVFIKSVVVYQEETGSSTTEFRETYTMYTTGVKAGAVKEGSTVGIIAGYTKTANTNKTIASWSVYNQQTYLRNYRTGVRSGKKYTEDTIADYLKLEITNDFPANILVLASNADFNEFKEIHFDANGGDNFTGTLSTSSSDTVNYTYSSSSSDFNSSGQLLRYGMYKAITGQTTLTGGVVTQLASTETTSNRKEYISAVKTGYVFTGWYTEAVGGEKILDYTGKFNKDNDCVAVAGYSRYVGSVGYWDYKNTITLYAHYEKVGTTAIICNNPSENELYHNKINGTETTTIDANNLPHHHVSSSLADRVTKYTTAPSGATQTADNAYHDSAYPYWIINRDANGNVTSFVPFTDSAKTALCDDYVVFIKQGTMGLEIYLTQNADGSLTDKVVSTSSNDYSGLPLPVERESNGNYKTNADGTYKLFKGTTWNFNGFVVTSAIGEIIKVTNALGKLNTGVDISSAIELTDNSLPVIYASYTRNSVEIVLDAGTSYSAWPGSGWKDNIGSGTFNDGSTVKTLYTYLGATELYTDKNCLNPVTYSSADYGVTRTSTDPLYTLTFAGWVYYTNNSSFATNVTASTIFGTNLTFMTTNSFILDDAESGQTKWNYTGNLTKIYLNANFTYGVPASRSKFVLSMVEGTSSVIIRNTKNTGMNITFGLKYTTEDGVTSMTSFRTPDFGKAFTTTVTDITTKYKNNPSSYSDINTATGGATVYYACSITVRFATGGTAFTFYGYIDAAQYEGVILFSLPSLTDGSNYTLSYGTLSMLDDHYIVAEGPIWFTKDVNFTYGELGSDIFSTDTTLKVSSSALTTSMCHYIQTNAQIAVIENKDASGTVISRHAYLSQALAYANQNSNITTIDFARKSIIHEYMTCEKKQSANAYLKIKGNNSSIYFTGGNIYNGLVVVGGSSIISDLYFARGYHSTGYAFSGSSGNACIKVRGDTSLTLNNVEFNISLGGSGAVIYVIRCGTLNLTGVTINSSGAGYALYTNNITRLEVTGSSTIKHYGTASDAVYILNCTSASIYGSTIFSENTNGVYISSTPTTINSSTLTSTKESALYCYNSTVTLSATNTFKESQRGIGLDRSTLVVNSTPTFTNNKSWNGGDIRIIALTSYATAPIKWNCGSPSDTIMIYTGRHNSATFPWKIVECDDSITAKAFFGKVKTDRYVANLSTKYITLIDAVEIEFTNNYSGPMGTNRGLGLISGESLLIQYGTLVDGVVNGITGIDTYSASYNYRITINGVKSGLSVKNSGTVTLPGNATIYDTYKDSITGFIFQYLPRKPYLKFIDDVQTYFVEKYGSSYQNYLANNNPTDADLVAIQKAYQNFQNKCKNDGSGNFSEDLYERAWFAFTTIGGYAGTLNEYLAGTGSYLPNLLSFVVDDTNNAFSYTEDGKILPCQVSETNPGSDTPISVTDPVEVERDFNFSAIFDRSIFEGTNKVLIVTLLNPKSASSKIYLLDINSYDGSSYNGATSNNTECKIPFSGLISGTNDNLYNIFVLISH